MLIGSGWIQFTPEGALYEDELPALDVSFLSGLVNQPIDIDLGPSIQEGSSSGLTGTTGFASETSVYAGNRRTACRRASAAT